MAEETVVREGVPLPVNWEDDQIFTAHAACADLIRQNGGGYASDEEIVVVWHALLMIMQRRESGKAN